jgi:sulfite reductase alpha subunit-like flavoprotein
LYNRLVQLGAKPICDKGEADEQHPEGVDGTFVPWTINFRTQLLERFPLPVGVDAIPDNVNLEPRWKLESVDGESRQDDENSASSAKEEPPRSLIPISGGIASAVLLNTRITAESHYQDTRHIALELPNSHSYGPGDTLTIYPKNFPSDVSEFITRMDWTSVADKPIRFVSNRPESHSALDLPPIPNLPNAYVLTLRELLTNHLDIMSIPRRSFFVQLLHYTSDEMHIERLQEFVSPDLVDELYDYTTRPRRSILEVLSDFTSVKLPWEKICSILPLMRGRQFSIASGGELKHVNSIANSQNTKVELLIAIVKYRTILKRIRHGVATRYIATLQPGQNITVTLQKGGLNITQADVQKPIVMVAPGTGVAPMRSLAWERKSQRHNTNKSVYKKDILFFGCRKKDADEYFVTEWPSLSVQLFTAYSREQVRG